MTDEAAQYHGRFRSAFLGHGRVNHAAGEYGRGLIHTDTAESSFSVLNDAARDLGADGDEAYSEERLKMGGQRKA